MSDIDKVKPILRVREVGFCRPINECV